MKKITLLILMMVIGFAGFAKQKRHKKKKKASSGIVSVTMHRTTCFGRCPDYMIEIKNDGTVTYTAIRFTEDTGIFTKNIGSKAAADLLNKFAANRVDTCQDVYDNRIPDLPGIIYSIDYGSKVKSIHNAGFGPYFLKNFAVEIDAVGKKTDNNGWKKTGTPNLN